MRETSLNQNDIHEGELPRGTTVYAKSGEKVGQVRLSALRDGYFVVEQGWLLTHELFLPATAIAKREAVRIGLNLSKAELRQPRWRVPSDEWLVSGSNRPIIPPTHSEREDSPTGDQAMPPAESELPQSHPES